MDVEIETYSALPCTTKRFYINGISADTDDFGYITDTDPDNAPDYGCGCMEFIPSDDKMRKAMEKYSISAYEFRTVQYMLEDKLYVGSCGWCS